MARFNAKSKILDPCLVDRQFQCQAERIGQMRNSCVLHHFMLSVLIKLLIGTYSNSLFRLIQRDQRTKDYHPVLQTEWTWNSTSTLNNQYCYILDKSLFSNVSRTFWMYMCKFVRRRHQILFHFSTSFLPSFLKMLPSHFLQTK